ncbi:hypothetical protein MMC14_002503 [Varicellaria rhodocarpa]|nr:hypothetical protein [Varicellaria rhodocarpa]
MTSALSGFIRRGAAFLTPTGSSTHLPTDGIFTTAKEGNLFPKVDPAVDGEECDHDCESCTIQYPPKWNIEEDGKVYGLFKPYATHMIVATGKSDWVRDVEDEKGSVMEAVRDCGVKPKNGRLMISASNMPIPSSSTTSDNPTDQPTTVLLLPTFTIIENVTPASVPELINHYVSPSITNTSPLPFPPGPVPPEAEVSAPARDDDSTISLKTQPGGSTSAQLIPQALPDILPTTHPFSTRPCPHSALILLCSQKTRDARCGQSAPLLRREFERHLRPLGLYRDLNDERTNGVGIYFINHVGGHKFAANVIIYRKASMTLEGRPPAGATVQEKEAVEQVDQCIWLARVRPEDCENIVKQTVLKGKLVKPERQLRGGFDRGRGLTSW